jgi:hypothetical protein
VAGVGSDSTTRVIPLRPDCDSGRS